MTHKIHKTSDCTEVWECLQTQHKSLHASIVFRPGDIIIRFSAKEILTQPNYLSLQIDRDRHIVLEPDFLQFTNHSCEPNIYFDPKAMEIIALNPIQKQEELTFFYPSTEWIMNRGFACLCGSSQCLKKIQGAAQINPNILYKYRLSEHIKELLAS